MATTNQDVFDMGYADAMAGRKFNEAYDGDRHYEDGFDAGQCDRPTLDELMPLDAAKEAGRWWT